RGARDRLRRGRFGDRDTSMPGTLSAGGWQGLTGGLPHARKLLLGGWVAPLSNRPAEAKQPNSPIRQSVSIQLIQNGGRVAALTPNRGCLNFIGENDKVLLAGFGRKGHPAGNIHGVQGCQSSQCFPVDLVQEQEGETEILSSFCAS
uniref:Small ribosomal subunit protein uS12 n=1 Tax=Buteo japonicus TaxID=224669 RepID=A0A8C0ARG5_9AVES